MYSDKVPRGRLPLASLLLAVIVVSSARGHITLAVLLEAKSIPLGLTPAVTVEAVVTVGGAEVIVTESSGTVCGDGEPPHFLKSLVRFSQQWLLQQVLSR